MNTEIYNRAYEMIANGYEFGQIQNGDTWECLLDGGPYSDIYTCAEKLEEEFRISISLGLKYLKKAFDQYETVNDEMYESKNMKKNVVKINENALRKIVAESVKKVLKENGYDSYPESGYEPFKKIGESAAYWVMDRLTKEYPNDVDSEAIEYIISHFTYSLKALADVGDIDNGVRGFGVKP